MVTFSDNPLDNDYQHLNGVFNTCDNGQIVINKIVKGYDNFTKAMVKVEHSYMLNQTYSWWMK